MNKTKIEYLDYTWSPTVGCEGIGCAVRKVCWAEAQAKRQKQRCELCYSFVPHVHWERFKQPLAVKKPSRIGVSFSGEFFSEQIAENVRASLYMIMEKCPQHSFIILTKQPQNVSENKPPKNVWIGVSVNTKKDLWRLSSLRDIETSVRIVSAEPLLEDLTKIDLSGIGWLIVGAQTRPYLEPKEKWVWNLILEATAKKVPIFLKNNLHHANPIQEFPEP